MTTLDLNLLRVFDVLLEERSVTRAGARLGLTQSAVSHALNRLRYSLDDELFVRGPAGMQPTQRALDMGTQVHAALAQLQAAVAPGDFAPLTSERRFVMIAGAYACVVLAPPLVGRLAEEAPLVELSIGQYRTDAFDLLDAHRADFLVSGAVAAPARFARDVILRERLAWVVRAEHPLAERPEVSLADLAATPHVVIAPALPGLTDEPAEHRGVASRASWEDYGAFEAALAAAGLSRRVGVAVPDPFSAIAVVARSDMATLIPKRLATVWAQSGRVKLIEPPYDSPPVDVALFYPKDRLADPAIAWMRELVRTTAATL